MADGNVGSLYMTLGLKDEVSAGLGKVVKSLTKSKSYTDELKREVEGLRKELKGVSGTDMSEPIKKALSFIKKYDNNVWKSIETTNKLAYTLRGVFENNNREINIKLGSIHNAIREVSKLSKQLDGISDKDEKTAFKSQVSNALDYLRILQDISRKQAELNTLSKSSRNIDKAEIASAKNALNDMQMALVKQIFNRATNSSSLIDNNFISEIKKLLSMSLREIGDYMRNLKKDNPLSVFVNSADMLTSKIAAANSKILEMQSLMRGSNIPNLMDTRSLDEMRGLVGAMSKLTNEKGIGQKTEKAKIDKLVSDYARLSSEMSLAMSTFRRMSREYDNANSRLVSWYSKYRELQSIRDKRVSLYLDTKEVDAELNRIRALFGELNTIRNGLKAGNEGFIGMLGSRGTGVDAGIYNNVKKAANEEITAREKIAKQAERFVENEIKAEQRRNEQRLKDLDHEAIALQRNAEIQQKLQAQQERSQKRQDIEALKEEYRLKDAKLKQLDREGRALQRNAEIQQRLQDQKERSRKKADKEAADAEKQRQRELEVSQRRVQSLEKAYVRLKEATLVSKSYGLSTRDAETQIARLSAEIDTLKGKISILQTAGFKSVLGTEMYTGTGKSVTEANRIASHYERANREAEKNAAIEEKRKQKIAESGRQIQSSLVKGFKDANNAAGRLNSTVQDLKSLFMQGGLVFGAQQFAMSIIRTGGEMEKQHIAMQSILGDMQNANTMFNQTKELALQSPFTFSELNRDVKQLAAYGVEYENLYDTTKRLADMASGLGVSFERIALAFGQVQARGWLDGKELRQIAYAGIPLLDRLSKYYSQREGKKVTTSDVKGRITNREVSFQDVKNIFWEMTDAGGQFYNMQLTLSETLLGRYNKLKDAWEIMLSDFARGDSIIGGTFKTILDSLTYIVQQMHTLGPVMSAAFIGFAIKKGITAMGGTKGDSFLASKANIASGIQAKIMQGEKLSAIEQRILATKNRITNEDLKALAASRALTLQDLNRLRISGQITAEQYKQYRNILQQQAGHKTLNMQIKRLLVTMRGLSFKNGWSNFTTSGMAAMRIFGSGIKALGATLWSAIGGLPGMIVTGLSMGIMSVVSKYQDLTQKIKQTQDEIFDRRKQVAEFTRDNNANKAIASGDEKEMEKQIDAYKEKLKELAPYDYSNLVMKADEKKSHEERLKFLEQELKLIYEANKANSGRFVDNGTWYEDLLGITGKGRDSYSGLMSVIKDIDKSASRYLLLQAKANAFGATKADQAIFNLNKNGFQDYALKVKEFISKEFGDISKDENLRRQAVQAMNSIFSALGVSSENANLIRASVLQAFGIYNDGWLSEEVGKRMSDLISERFPEIALKIKSDQSLNEGEKKKVAQLMNDAKNELINRYPVFSTTLQNLLDQSNFTAVISLVTQGWGGSFNDMQKELAGRVPKNPDTEMLQYYSGLVDSWGKEGDWYSARNKAQSDISLARNQYRSAVDSKSEKAGKYKKKYKDLMLAAEILLNYDYEGELKKSNKEPKGSKEDEQLKRLRKRIELYKKFYSEYKKLQDLVGNGALDKLRKDGEFEPVFKYGLNNITDYESSVRQLLGSIPANTADRKDYRNQAIADIQTKNRELFSEQISKDNDELRTQLGIISEQYEVYKKMFKLTADSEGAMSVAFGGGMATKTYSEYLKSEMAKILPAHNKNTGLSYSLEDVLGMSQSQYDSAYGKNNSRFSVLFGQYKEELKKIKTETVNMIADIIEKNGTLEQQLKDVDTEYEYQLGLIKEVKDLTPEMRKRAEEGLMKTSDDKKAQIRFELFKQNSDWVAIFDDLDRVSTNTINSMIDKIDTFSKTTGLSVEVVKQLRDALEKLRDKSIERNPLDALLNSTSRGNAIGKLIRQNKSSFNLGKKITIDAATAKKTGLTEGQSYTKSELENEQESAYSGFPASLAALQKKFESLSSVLNPVLDLFNALGMEDNALVQGMGLVSGALGAASGVAGGLNTLGLSSLGPYGAAIGAGLSVVSGLFAMHDKALQKEIEASERRQKEMENMTKNIESVLESALGGVYSYKASRDTTEILKKVTRNYEENMGFLKSSNFIADMFGQSRLIYSKETYQQAVKAKQSGTAYDAELASLMAQRDELKKQRQAEEDKKKTDADAIQNYDQQIKEMEQSIDDFTQTFLNDIYSIDIKSWASQLTDSIVEAWSKGEDAATAYHDKVQELIKDLTKNILSQKIMEMALQPTLDSLQEILKQKGKLDETDIPKIANQLIEAGNNTVENISNILDALKEQGWDLSENGTLSVSNSIKNITEDTADLLASYLNAIRLDVSVNRENLRLILVAVQAVPELNNIARSQLTQLTTLVALAEARNSKLDDMYSWMNKVTNGVLKISMK